MTQLNKGTYLPSGVLTHILSYCDDRIERKQRFLNKRCMMVVDMVSVCKMKRRYKLEKIVHKFVRGEGIDPDNHIYEEALDQFAARRPLYNFEVTMGNRYLIPYEIGGDLII
jgi:hypothetical protein